MYLPQNGYDSRRLEERLGHPDVSMLMIDTHMLHP
jgi:site-specific recombinase XerD